MQAADSNQKSYFASDPGYNKQDKKSLVDKFKKFI